MRSTEQNSIRSTGEQWLVEHDSSAGFVGAAVMIALVMLLAGGYVLWHNTHAHNIEQQQATSDRLQFDIRQQQAGSASVKESK